LLISINKIIKKYPNILLLLHYSLIFYFTLIFVFNSGNDPLKTISSKFLNHIPSDEITFFQQKSQSENQLKLNEKELKNVNLNRVFSFCYKNFDDFIYRYYNKQNLIFYNSDPFIQKIIPRSPPKVI
jgi:hypothetical protein